MCSTVLATSSDARRVLNEYEQHLRRLNRRPGTIRNYTSRMRLFLRAHPDWRHLDALTIERWLDGRGLEAGGRAWWVTLLRGFYRWAVDAGEVDDDRAARQLVRPKVRKYLPRPVQPADIVMALELAHGPMRRAIALMVYGGLRCCEVAALRWADTDVPAGAMYVVGKGGRTRWVPIHPELARHLGAIGTGPTIGETWSAAKVSWSVRRYLQGIGIAATAHQLRHSFGTAAYRSTHDIKAVAELLGHVDTKTTQVYVQVDDQALRAAVEAITYAAA